MKSHVMKFVKVVAIAAAVGGLTKAADVIALLDLQASTVAFLVAVISAATLFLKEEMK